MFGRRFGKKRAPDVSSVAHEPVASTSKLADEDVHHLGQLPGVTGNEIPLEEAPELAPLTAISLRALRRLARYKASPDTWPMRRRAAVLIALFGGRHGDLYVVLSRRSPRLRSYGGDTALPGGKLEPNDLDLTYTARREAFEEIGLPIHTESVRYLCSLRPFLTRTSLIVTPIVVYILDPSLQARLLYLLVRMLSLIDVQPEINPDEVSSVFAHPLQSFLFQVPREPVLHSLSEEVQRARRPYHMSWDLPWMHGKPYRWHRFESKKHPIIGFTADILIEAAEIAYGKADFERRAPGQFSRKRLIDICVAEDPIFAEAPNAEDQSQDDVKARL